jgi:hypothetical protein
MTIWLIISQTKMKEGYVAGYDLFPKERGI